MKTKLKICGITRLEDARYAAAAGADYLGFIQYERSPRCVEPRRVREIVDWVYGPLPVGVFVNATADDVNRVADEAGFEMIQLHGDEPAFEARLVERPVIKALRVAPETTTDELLRTMREYEDVVEGFLLDTHSDVLRGGTGTAFDWEIARGLSERYRIFLAGGLKADNVARAIDRLRPFAVDVSSSLESAPGVKDFERIDDFITSLGTADRAEPQTDT